MKYNLNFRTILYLTLPFLFLYASTAQTAEPICTHDGSNDAVCCKEVPFGGRVDTKLHFGVKKTRNVSISFVFNSLSIEFAQGLFELNLKRG